ncbi:unnamed protein product, partial [marine sediment metagenome]
IVAWLKNFSGTPILPEEWVECSGQTLNDPESPYNGKTIPNLNGGEFLRGSSTSGGTGGATTINLLHTHNLTGETGIGGTTTMANVGTQHKITGWPDSHPINLDTDSKLSSNQSILPPYYDVVWIMRIK